MHDRREAAAFFGCSKRTMLRYLDETSRDPMYREAWERGRQNGKSSLTVADSQR